VNESPAVTWAESSWTLPETRKPIRLRRWQKAVLRAMFPADGSPSPYETFLISTVKKGGKTTLNAIATMYAALTRPAPETVYVVANDEAQAQERVYDLIAGSVRRMGLVAAGAAVVSKGGIVFPETGTKIVALPADFAGAAGAIFGVSSWTELWAFRHEGHVRLWEELTPIPGRRSLRIVDSYAGFAGDSPILEPMWGRALKGERLDDELAIFAAGRLWAFVDTGEEAQRRAWLGDPADFEGYYAEQAETLRPGTFARLHLNLWQSGEEAFVTAEDWDGCVDVSARPLRPEEARRLRLSIGVDVATKSDCAAVVAVARDGERLRLVRHRIWTPRKGEPLDIEETVEAFLLDLHRQYRVRAVRADPYQMARSIASLRKAGIRIEELPQTSGNLTACGQNLYELIRGRNIAIYPDAELRQHALNAVAIESARGWRLAKEKAARKIDGVAALSFACLDAVGRRGGGRMTSHLPRGRLDRPLRRGRDQAPERPPVAGGVSRVQNTRLLRRPARVRQPAALAEVQRLSGLGLDEPGRGGL
jgi:phage terminase large subunit-like protein